MANQLELDDVLMRIRDKLNKEGVKLWLEPYFDENSGCKEAELQLLAQEYAKSLNIELERCLLAVKELQRNALERLKQRDKFKESGIASFKVRLVQPGQQPLLFTQEIPLSSFGTHLKTSIAETSGIIVERLKLIANGIVIKDGENLSCQNLRNGQQILAIVLLESAEEANQKEERLKNVEKTKEDTILLAEKDDDYLQLEDQHGNAIHIPANEKKSLMVAMTLHEKGKKALKDDDYALALVYFLDADKEFSQVNSKLLDSVDNYALLDLDIAWCYLNLNSLVHLPEANRRLKRCEESFHKSYGRNLERLIAVKGTPGNEAALFMRLHLLQSIVLYHENEREKALNLLKEAQNELSALKVDEIKLISLVELGYSTAEARLGLRATQGDLNLAANYINENRQKRIESRRKAAAERIFYREKQKFGLCDDKKQYVDPNFVKILVNMGYSRDAAKSSLKKCNNIITDAIQYISEHPLAGPSKTKSKELLSLIDDLVPELVQAGFDEKMSRKALKKHKGDVMMAADELLRNDGIILDENLSDDDELKEIEKEEEREKKKAQEAYARLSKDISMVDDDHLDLTLDKEEEFLVKYLSLLQ